MKKDSFRHSSALKNQTATQSLLDQSDMYVRRLHLENIKQSTLDRSITYQEAVLTDRKMQLKPALAAKLVYKQTTIIENLTNELHYARTQLAETVADIERVKAEVDTVRRELKQDQQYITHTGEMLAEVNKKISDLAAQRKASENQLGYYDQEIRRIQSVDRKVYFIKGSKTQQNSKRHRQSNHSLSLPSNSFEPPRADLLRSLVTKWKSKVESQRLTVNRYMQYIADVAAGFAAVNDSSPNKTAEEFIAWMDKERVLKVQCNLIQDEVMSLEVTIEDSKAALQRLKQAQSGHTDKEVLCTAPLLAALLKQTDHHSKPIRNSQDVDLLRTIVSSHTEEIRRLGKIYEIQAADKHDHLKALWEPLTDLKSSFSIAGFEARQHWEDTGFSLESLTELVFHLEQSLERLVEFLRVRGEIRKHDEPGLSPKPISSHGFSLRVLPEDVYAHHPLTHSEFRKRAAEKFSTQIST